MLGTASAARHSAAQHSAVRLTGEVVAEELQRHNVDDGLQAVHNLRREGQAASDAQSLCAPLSPMYLRPAPTAGRSAAPRRITAPTDTLRSSPCNKFGGINKS